MDQISPQSAHWWQCQLEERIKRLIKAVNVLVYTKSKAAKDSVAVMLDDVEESLCRAQASSSAQQAVTPNTISEDSLSEVEGVAKAVDQWLFAETHQLLAHARRLVDAPIKPHRQVGNVIQMRRNYSDLADAEFERLLAASDVPVLCASGTGGSGSQFVDMSNGCPYGPDEGRSFDDPNDDPNGNPNGNPNGKANRPVVKLKLVYSDRESASSSHFSPKNDS